MLLKNILKRQLEAVFGLWQMMFPRSLLSAAKGLCGLKCEFLAESKAHRLKTYL